MNSNIRTLFVFKMSFLLTGQTDSGKSTIAGHLLLKTGYFNTLPDEDRKAYRVHLDNMESNKSKSKYSILMDLLDGEVLNNKTKTQEFSIHEFMYNDLKYKLIDTPGHQLYIRSLLEGLFHVNPNVICLVVSCIDTEFNESWERGTVKEDLLLSRSIGCKHLVVLWNKYDLAQPSQSIQNKLNTFCKGLKFNTIDPLFVSGYTGENLLNILEYVSKYSNERVETKESKENVSNQISVKGLFFLEDKSLLISRGLQFVLHHSSGEYDVEIQAIKDKNQKNIVIVRNNELLEISLNVTNTKINYTPGSKVIFRYQKKTIGFGVILE